VIRIGLSGVVVEPEPIIVRKPQKLVFDLAMRTTVMCDAAIAHDAD
jgi:hypothetical protein